MVQFSERLSHENNKQYSYRAIKEGIMSLELQPGQTLNLADLAQTLNVSSTPIKEAMGRLQEEKLVEVIPQVGTYVSKIDLQLIEEAVFMRFVLEKETLKSACHSFPQESLKQLKKNLDLQVRIWDQKGNVWEFHELDTKFHSIIFQGVQRKNIWKAITGLGTHYKRMMMLSATECYVEDQITHHKNILSIIENKKNDQVENILSRHILEPIKDSRSLFPNKTSHSGYFEINKRSGILV